MPRKHRRWEPGAIHHVIVRAHDGDPIFEMDDDRQFVVGRAARVFEEEGATCFGWAVLVNHFHMLVRFPGPPKTPMQRLNTAIAIRVRRLHRGRGPVFQDRFFGDPCADTASLLRRLAYVTANPIHHRIVASLDALESHPWSSFGEVTGRRPAKLTDPDATLSLLDAPRGRAVGSFRELLANRVRAWDEEDAACAVPRDPDVDSPLEPESAGPSRAAPAVTVEAVGWERMATRRDRLRALGWGPLALIGPSCAVTGAKPVAVRAGDRSRAVSRARAVAAFLACDHLYWPSGEVATALGVSLAAMSRGRRKGPGVLRAAGVTAAELLRRSGAEV